VEIGSRVLPLQFLLSISVTPHMIRSTPASFVEKFFIGSDDTVPDRKDAIVVRIPEDHGIVLPRMPIHDRNENAKLQEYQRGITYTPLRCRHKAHKLLRKRVPTTNDPDGNRRL
jgi:hypothetical protein